MRGEVTFTSDFGLADPYVGEVKGVILSCEPETRVTDLTHGIEPGDLASAAFVLMNGFRCFPDGTVHLAVVDPGVGSARDILVVATRRCVFVGPDNGVLYEAARSGGIEAVHALETQRFLEEIGRVYAGNPVVERILAEGASAVFHGRDLFAPLAAYLACRGARGDFSKFARPRESMAKLEIGEPVDEGNAVLGKIVYVDRFGNLVSNIRASSVSAEDEVLIRAGGAVSSLGRLRRTYSEAPNGAALPLIGSRGRLEIAVNGGSAKALFGAAAGDGVIVLRKG